MHHDADRSGRSIRADQAAGARGGGNLGASRGAGHRVFHPVCAVYFTIDEAPDRTDAVLTEGRFDSPVPVDGPAEVQIFARTFEAMAHSLKDSRSLLEESTERLTNILAASATDLARSTEAGTALISTKRSPN